MLTVENLTFRYPNGGLCIRNLSFSARDGACVGIIGANGAGKTTLFRLLTGLLLPQSGEIAVSGVSLSPKTLPEIRKSVGYVFQNPDDMLFCATVREDVLFGLRQSGLPPEEMQKTADAALSALGIATLADQPPDLLSGGEKKRASLACVLAMSPSVLLLDEPTAFLDPRGRRELTDLLSRLPQTRLIATHDLALAAALCDQILLLQHGEVRYFGDAQPILNNTAFLEECGL